MKKLNYITWLLLSAALLLLPCEALAQGCGQTNPNCIVPTAPPGTNNNQAASTAFVQAAVVANTVLTPEQFGGGPSVTDNSTAFIALATQCRALGGCTVRLQPAAIYRIYPFNIAAGTYTLFDFSNTTGVWFQGNGAKITTAINMVNGGNVTINAIQLLSSFDVHIDDLWLDQSFYTQKNELAGFIAVNMQDSVQRVTMSNLRMSGGGRAGLWCVRSSALSFDSRAKDITLLNANFQNVAYPHAFQKNCDQYFGRGIYSTGADRVYFIYNVINQDVELWSDANSAIQDVVINNSHDAAEAIQLNTTANINVKYTFRPSAVWVSPNSFISAGFQNPSGAEGPASIRNVHFTVDIENRTDNTATAVFTTYNQTTTPQGRLFENVTLSGSVYENPAAPGDVIELFADKNWTGDPVRNFAIRDFIVTSDGSALSLVVDGRAIEGVFVLDGLWGNANTAYSPSNLPSAKTNYSNSFFPTTTALGAVWTASTPTPTCNAGTGTLSSVLHERVLPDGKSVLFTIQVTVTTVNTCTGNVVVTLGNTTAFASGFGGRNVTDGKSISGSIAAASAVLNLQKYDNTFPAANGDVLVLNGSYTK